MSDFGYLPEPQDCDGPHHKLEKNGGSFNILKTQGYVVTEYNSVVQTIFVQDAGKQARNSERMQEETMTVTTSGGVVWVIETDIEAPFNETPYRLTDPEKEWVKTSVKQDLDRREQGQFSCPTVSCYTSDKESIVPVRDSDSYKEPTNSFSGNNPTFTEPGW